MRVPRGAVKKAAGESEVEEHPEKEGGQRSSRRSRNALPLRNVWTLAVFARADRWVSRRAWARPGQAVKGRCRLGADRPCEGWSIFRFPQWPIFPYPLAPCSSVNTLKTRGIAGRPLPPARVAPCASSPVSGLLADHCACPSARRGDACFIAL